MSYLDNSNFPNCYLSVISQAYEKQQYNPETVLKVS